MRLTLEEKARLVSSPWDMFLKDLKNCLMLVWFTGDSGEDSRFLEGKFCFPL